MEAESLMERARHIGERAQSWNAVVSWRLQLYVLRREQGRLDEIEDPGPPLARRVPDLHDLGAASWHTRPPRSAWRTRLASE